MQSECLPDLIKFCYFYILKSSMASCLKERSFFASSIVCMLKLCDVLVTHEITILSMNSLHARES
jgi:hypothetical protein